MATMTYNQAKRYRWPFAGPFEGCTLEQMAGSDDGLRKLDLARDWKLRDRDFKVAIILVCERFEHEIDRLFSGDD